MNRLLIVLAALFTAVSTACSGAHPRPHGADPLSDSVGRVGVRIAMPELAPPPMIPASISDRFVRDLQLDFEEAADDARDGLRAALEAARARRDGPLYRCIRAKGIRIARLVEPLEPPHVRSTEHRAQAIQRAWQGVNALFEEAKRCRGSATYILD